jgi:hypothetical protein
MKDVDKFKKLFDEIGQQYDETHEENRIILWSDEGKWWGCVFEFDIDGKFIKMSGGE